MANLQDVAEQREALQERRRTVFTEPPKLLGEVPTEEVGVLAEIILVDRKVMVGKTAMASTGALHHGPRTFLRTRLQPRTGHGIAVRTDVVGSRQGNVEHHVRKNIFRHHLDDTLGVGIVPCVDMHQQHGPFRRDRPSQGCIGLGFHQACPNHQDKRNARQERPFAFQIKLFHKSNCLIFNYNDLPIIRTERRSQKPVLVT